MAITLGKSLRLLAALAVSLFVAHPALAQSTDTLTITSSGPDEVEVSIYRGPGSGGGTLDLRYLEGFALISETRKVTLPAGPATIRFEGVASGIEPASALVKGVGIDEKNQDANLLSHRGLLDHFTGQQVTLKRTDPVSGAVTEERATIRSGSNRLLIQTARGFESVACTGLNQTLVFDTAPKNLSAKPTLSVAMPDQPGGTYTVTLTYLAANFDWRANYVAQLSDDGTRADILGWLTMASNDATSFMDARTNAIAGDVYREDKDSQNSLYSQGFQPVRYQCWPAGTTGQFQGYRNQQRQFALFGPPPPPPPNVVNRMFSPALEDSAIVVTGARIAEREELGDLKLYRVPFPTVVAANSQKQVAFLKKEGVEGEIIYQLEVHNEDRLRGISRVFRLQNERKNGLGEPLPAGQFAFFQNALGARQLVGEDRMDDKAVGEEIEFELGMASNVTATIEDGRWDEKNDRWEEYILTIRNANPVAITLESEFLTDEDTDYRRFSKRMGERDGRPLWRTTVPANGQMKLVYRAYERRERDAS